MWGITANQIVRQNDPNPKREGNQGVLFFLRQNLTATMLSTTF